MTHGSLFSGIGGFDLAAEWMGWQNLFHCEWNPFGQKVLKHYWPNAESFEDITKTNFTKYANKVDIISGGFPCQPFSLAGKRKGTDDERYLWGEMFRAVQEVKPKYVIAENVLGITNIAGGVVFEQVCLDLEAEGYEVQPFIIGAAAKNAPHRRDRCWFIGINTNTDCNGFNKRNIKDEINAGKGRIDALGNIEQGIVDGNATNTESFCIQRQRNGQRKGKFRRGNWCRFPSQSPICGGNDGLPAKLDGITFPKWRKESIMGYGNAIVPNVAYEIFKVIQKIDDEKILLGL